MSRKGCKVTETILGEAAKGVHRFASKDFLWSILHVPCLITADFVSNAHVATKDKAGMLNTYTFSLLDTPINVSEPGKLNG